MSASQALRPRAGVSVRLNEWGCWAATRSFTVVNRSLILIVLVITLVAFVGSLRYDFVYDDVEQIVGNRYVHSWHYLPRFFTEHVWGHLNSSSPGTYYRPIFLLWLLLNHSVFGLQASGWHFTTVALHVLVTYTVYRLALGINLDRLTACVAALLFGLHPVHVEAVAWVSGGTEPLLAALFVPAFLCYLRARAAAGRSRWWLALSLLLYGLAQSKVTVITGDGCMQMHGLDVQTAARYGLPIIYVVLNNNALGNVWLRAHQYGQLPSALTTIPDHDWAGFARALGAQGLTVDDPAALGATFGKALAANTTVLIDVKADKNCPTPVYDFSAGARAWS